MGKFIPFDTILFIQGAPDENDTFQHLKDENEKHNALAIDTATEDQMERLDHQQKLPTEEEATDGEGNEEESDIEMENEEFEKPQDEDKKKKKVKQMRLLLYKFV